MKNVFRMPKTVKDFVVILLVIGVIGGGVWWFWFKDAAVAVSGEVTYLTTMLRPTTIQDVITGSGNLKANDSAEIRNAVTGKVEEIYVKDGDYVVKDQPLYRLSNSTLQTNLQQAQLDRATAQSNFDKLVLQNSSSAGQLRDAQLKVDQKQNAYDAVITSRDNLRVVATESGNITDINVREGEVLSASTSLFGFYSHSKENETDYQIKLQQAKANLEAKQKDLDKLTVSVDFSGVVTDLSVKPGVSVLANELLLNVSEPDRLTKATSSDTVLKIEQAELALTNREKDLSYLEVTAPATGMLSGLDLKPGDSVATSTNLATINDNRQLLVKVNVPQSFINGVALGNKAEVMITNSARTYKGVVTNITPTGNLDSSSYVISYPVEITIDNDGTLLAGMSAVVDISSSDSTFKSISSQRGTLANEVTKAVNPKVSGDIVELRAKNGDWVLEGQVIAVLKNDNIDLAYRQAQEDLKKLLQDEFRSPSIATVKEVLVKNGDAVRPGQTLLTLQSDAVEAAYASAKNDYDKLLRRETGNTDIRNKTAGTVEKIYIKVGDTVQPGQLLAELSSNDMIYQQERALADLEQAKAELQSLLINTSAGELELARLKLEQAELTLENRQKQVDDLVIKALITGTITEKNSPTVGDEFTELSTQIGTIYDYSAFKLTINVDELEIPKIRVGSEVSVTVDAFPDISYPAIVSQISNEGTVATGGSTYPVTVLFTTPDPLRAAMTSTATIVLQKVENTFAVLKSAVKTFQTGTAISYRVELLVDDEPVLTDVTVGMSTTSMIELTGGVKEGDRVITGRMNNATGTLTTGGGTTAGIGGNQVRGGQGGGMIVTTGPGGR